MKKTEEIEYISTDQKDVSKYYSNGRMRSSDEVQKIAEKWGKWKGLASFYLIMASISVEK